MRCCPTKNDALIALLDDFLDDHPEYRETIPVSKRDIIEKIIADLNIRVQRKTVADYIIKRAELILR